MKNDIQNSNDYPPNPDCGLPSHRMETTLKFPDSARTRHSALSFVTLSIMLMLSQFLSAEDILFPDDPRAIINVKTELGAVGDGKADDTAALQKAIELCFAPDQVHSRFIYLPKGTYRITKQLIFRPLGSDGNEGSMIGPWLFGESREQTVIKLSDGADGFADSGAPRAMIRGVSRPDGARMNADFFDRMVVNMTLDTGNNPGAIGIQFYSNNTGEMRSVSIRGNGTIGLDLGFNDQNGPLLIEDVSIDGFTIGVNLAYGLNSQTLSRIRISGCDIGVRHSRQIAAIEGLEVIGARVPVECIEGGILALLAPRFSKGPGTGPAVAITGDKLPNLYIRDLVAQGYGQGVDGGKTSAPSIKETSFKEYASGGMLSPGGADIGGGLFIDPPKMPTVPWPKNGNEWVCANDFGMTSGSSSGTIDSDDDGSAIQQAIDEAAKKGATTVYILGGKRGDPNWYHVRSDVRIHGSVNRVIGLGFVRILFGHEDPRKDPSFPENMPTFFIEDEAGAPPAVIIEHLNVFAPRPGYAVENKAKKRDLIVRAGTPEIIARENSRVFIANVVGGITMHRGSQIVARHLNAEGKGIQIHNDAGLLYIVGFKTEGSGTKILTTDNGRSEVFGSLIYNNTGDMEKLPCLEVRDAYLFSGGHQEVHFGGNWYATPVSQTVNGVTTTINKAAWMSWSAMRAGKAK